jgi:uncharacterized protein (DUF983 family)
LYTLIDNMTSTSLHVLLEFIPVYWLPFVSFIIIIIIIIVVISSLNLLLLRGILIYLQFTFIVTGRQNKKPESGLR